MYLLFLDPGITTGIAILNDNYDVIHSDNAQENELKDKFANLIMTYKFDHVVIEEVGTPSLSELNQALGRIKHICKLYFPDAFWTKAADWKQTPAFRAQVPKMWNGKRLTQHQKDSIKIGVWFLRFKLPKIQARSA